MVTRAPRKPAVAATRKPAAGVRKAMPAVKAAPAASKKPTAVKKVIPAKPMAAAPKTTPIAPAVAAPKVIAKPVISVKPAAEQKVKVKKAKLVRDSFTMPEDEYQVLSDVKKACLKAGLAVKKSELLRVGVALIRDLENAKLKAAIATLPLVKAGRPKKDK
jgi:hypothetical protein